MVLIEQQKALDAIEKCHKRCCRTDSNGDEWIHYETTLNEIESIKPTQEIIHCYECKYNPEKEWFGCPMAHLNERQRPEDAWCWRGERKDGDVKS